MLLVTVKFFVSGEFTYKFVCRNKYINDFKVFLKLQGRII